MPAHVRFRFNKVTGEVEEFLVDDQDRLLPEAEHDRIASEVGRFVAVNARIREVVDAGAAARAPQAAGEQAPQAAGEQAPIEPGSATERPEVA